MNIFSLDIYKGKYSEFLEIIKSPNHPVLVFTPNPEMLVKAYDDREFLDILKKADYLVPDANGLYVASLIQQGKRYYQSLLITFFCRNKVATQFGELIRGSALTKDLVYFAMEKGEGVLILDNYRITDPQNPFEIKKKLIQGKFSELFRVNFPKLAIDIIFDGEKPPKEIAELIQKKNVRFVFSCIGMKHQEIRLSEIFSFLSDSHKVVGLGVGSSFDYLLGLQKRAPVFLQKLGLEWLFRLFQNPAGRWKRIKTALIDFPFLIEKERNNPS